MFIRTGQDEIPNNSKHYNPSWYEKGWFVYVGFCGKVYWGRVVKGDLLTWKTPKYDCIWGIDKVFHHLKIDPDKKVWSSNGYITNRENYQKELDSYKPYFDKYGPVWLVDPCYIRVNPILDRWQFAKALPPQEAFFAVRQWVISQHRPEKMIPEVSDEMMAEIKGFSAKTSFRRDKGQGPKRKRK